MHYALFLQILYFSILSYHPIFRYIFHDRFLKVEFVENIYYFPRYRRWKKKYINSMQDDVTVQ